MFLNSQILTIGPIPHSHRAGYSSRREGGRDGGTKGRREEGEDRRERWKQGGREEGKVGGG